MRLATTEEEKVNEGGMGQLRDPDLGCKKTGHPKSHHASGMYRIPEIVTFGGPTSFKGILQTQRMERENTHEGFERPGF